MSLSIVPGYDFTFNELVTSEKLRKWIGGAHNTASLTASEVGVTASNTGDNLHTTATWATSATVGALTFNTSTGWVELTTDVGSVPIFGTQGGLFTKRLREGESSEAAFDRFYEGDVPNVLGVKPGLTPTLPAANYSTGEGYDNFGMSSVNVAAAIQGASDLSGHRASKTFARYPSEHSYNPAGAWTVATYVTGTSYVHSLYKLGGLQTLRFNHQMIPSAAEYTSITNTLIDSLGHDNRTLVANRDMGFVFYLSRNTVLRMFRDGSPWDVISSVTLTSAPGYDLAFDNEYGLAFIKSLNGAYCEVLSFNASSISLIGTHAAPDQDNSGCVAIDTTNKRVLLIEPTRPLLCTYNSLGSMSTGVTLDNVSGTYMHGNAVYDEDNDVYAFCGRDTGLFFVRATSDTGVTVLHTVTLAGRPYGVNHIGNNYLNVADDASGRHVYLCDGATGYSVVGAIDDTGDNGRRLSLSPDGTQLMSAGYNSSRLRVWEFSNSTFTLVQNITLDSNGWVGEYGANNIYATAYNGNGYVWVEGTITAAEGSTTVSGLRGNVSSGVWKLDDSSTENYPTRIIPLSQCFNYYGAQQLSVGFVQAILGKTDFRTGGYEF